MEGSARGQTAVLVEREAELGRLRELADAAAAGSGAAVVIEGPAGIGKSTLLGAVRELADERGVEWLDARGGELEQDFAYGVVRALFAPLLAREKDLEGVLDGPAALAAPVLGIPASRAAAGLPGSDPGTALHALFWLVANIASRGPLVVAVDDLHWVDSASLRFVAYLARRVDELPVLLVTASRPAAESHAPDLLERIVGDPLVHTLEPRPLTAAGVAELLRTDLGSETDGALGQACHRATGGNPLFVRAVARALETAEDEPDLDSLPDAGSRAIARSVALRLSTLGEEARELARAAAVLGASSELRQAAALAGLGEERAAQAADALVASGILTGIRPVEFAHPIVRSAVYREIPPATCGRRHAHAARLLGAEAVEEERVAPHLLATHPGGERWVVDVLRAAAARSTERGAPDAAVRHLRRALEEPPDHASRPKVLAELGRAELAAAPAAEAVEHLAEAVEEADDPRTAALLTQDLALALSACGRWADAVPALEQAAESVREIDPELSRRLEAHLIIAAGFDARTHPVWHDRLDRLSADMPAHSPGDRLLLGALATGRLILGGSAAAAADPAARAVDGGIVAEQTGDSAFVLNTCLALAFGGDFERCEGALEEAFAEVRTRGSLMGFARISLSAALLRLQQGVLAEAESHARAAVDTSREQGYLLEHLGHGVLLDVLVEQGALDTAAGLEPHGDLPDTFMHNWLLYGRGRLRLAQGRLREALADLEELGRREAKWRGSNPAVFPYRSELARGWCADGERERALALAREEVRLARAWGTPGALGRSLRGLAAVEEPRVALALLRESHELLEGSPWRLESAKTLVALGSALRRSRSRADSREPLYAGMELAQACGAAALVEHAREELMATGARPRRAVRTGVEALTPSERRVARMAAEGMTNREIASALFVTARTVEVHLTHAYQKLGISSRGQLPEVLGAG